VLHKRKRFGLRKELQSGCVDGAQVLAPCDLLTPRELAKRLKVPVSWVYKHTDNSRSNGQRLPVLRCDGFLRFSWPDVLEWLRGKK
jgi:hypothetical protein